LVEEPRGSSVYENAVRSVLGSRRLCFTKNDGILILISFLAENVCRSYCEPDNVRIMQHWVAFV